MRTIPAYVPGFFLKYLLKMKMNLRLKLRKNQSTVPTEKLTKDLHSLEILGDSIEKLPDLSHLENCRYLLLVCPELKALPALPAKLEIFKVKGGHFDLDRDLPPLRTLSLQGLKSKKDQIIQLSFPKELETIDLANNGLNEIPPSIYELPQLNRLSLDHNQLKNLSDKLMAMNSLNHLSLDHNPLTDADKQKLHDAFKIWF